MPAARYGVWVAGLRIPGAGSEPRRRPYPDPGDGGGLCVVAVPEGVGGVENGGVVTALPNGVPEVAVELPVVAGGVTGLVTSGSVVAVEVAEEEGALGDTSGVGPGAEGDGLVAGCGRGPLGSTRSEAWGRRSSPTAIPATARAEPAARCAARVRRRAETPAWRRSRCFGSKDAGSWVSRINCASRRSK